MGNHGAAEVYSERRCSSCSSLEHKYSCFGIFPLCLAQLIDFSIVETFHQLWCSKQKKIVMTLHHVGRSCEQIML